ncbi:PKD domain containing protein, putative [Heliorestis convoluta]|uniref:PKD domain containing protein, putative n=1 Tax=Heliorestis convoluta TaxID=356322 RepID=A0A5Q2MYD0_9FIRM|nr:PKD domain containing protein, putative [Heliorestis convoluta]
MFWVDGVRVGTQSYQNSASSPSVLNLNQVGSLKDGGYLIVPFSELDTWVNRFKGNRDFVRHHAEQHSITINGLRVINLSLVAALCGAIGIDSGYDWTSPWGRFSITNPPSGGLRILKGSATMKPGEELVIGFDAQANNGGVKKGFYNLKVSASANSSTMNTLKEGWFTTRISDQTGNIGATFTQPGTYWVTLYVKDGVGRNSAGTSSENWINWGSWPWHRVDAYIAATLKVTVTNTTLPPKAPEPAPPPAPRPPEPTKPRPGSPVAIATVNGGKEAEIFVGDTVRLRDASYHPFEPDAWIRERMWMSKTNRQVIFRTWNEQNARYTPLNITYGPNSYYDSDIPMYFDAKSMYYFNTPGVHVLALSVTGSNPMFAEDTVQVIVKERPNMAPIAKISANPTRAVEGKTITVSNNSRHPGEPFEKITEYKWDISGRAPIIQTTKQNLSFGPGLPLGMLPVGTHTISLTVKDQDGDISTDVTTVTVLEAKPVAAIRASASSIDEFENVTVFNESYHLGDPLKQIVEYRWEVPGHEPIVQNTKQNLVFSVDSPLGTLASGINTIKLTVKDNVGDISTASTNIAVKMLEPVADIAASNYSITEVDDVTIINNSYHSAAPNLSITEYRWTVPWLDEPIIQTTKQNIEFGDKKPLGPIPSGSQTITLTVKDDEGRISSDSVTIEVAPVYPTGEINITGHDGEVIDRALAGRQVIIEGTGRAYGGRNINSSKTQWRITHIDTESGKETVTEISGTMAPINDSWDNPFFNKDGEWKIELRLTDDALSPRSSQWISKKIWIIQDKPPIPLFSVIPEALRNIIDDFTIEATHGSYVHPVDMTLGDRLTGITWKLLFDENNDGTYTKGPVAELHMNLETGEVTTTEDKRYGSIRPVYKDEGELDSRKVRLQFNQVGRFKLELEAHESYEGWGRTIRGQTGHTFQKAIEEKVIEVDNIPPYANIDFSKGDVDYYLPFVFSLVDNRDPIVGSFNANQFMLINEGKSKGINPITSFTEYAPDEAKQVDSAVDYIMNNWINYPNSLGQWQVHTAGSVPSIRSTVNTQWTGFWREDDINRTEIEFEMGVSQNDGDDDWIGFSFRMNKYEPGHPNNPYSGNIDAYDMYFFAMDNRGIRHAGLYKLEKAPFTNDHAGSHSMWTGRWAGGVWTNEISYFTQIGSNTPRQENSFLPGSPVPANTKGRLLALQKTSTDNLRWRYHDFYGVKIVAEGNRIQIWVNGKLEIDYTDHDKPIVTGGYGPFAASQAYGTFRNININGASIFDGISYDELHDLVAIQSFDKPADINKRYLAVVIDARLREGNVTMLELIELLRAKEVTPIIIAPPNVQEQFMPLLNELDGFAVDLNTNMRIPMLEIARRIFGQTEDGTPKNVILVNQRIIAQAEEFDAEKDTITNEGKRWKFTHTKPSLEYLWMDTPWDTMNYFNANKWHESGNELLPTSTSVTKPHSTWEGSFNKPGLYEISYRIKDQPSNTLQHPNNLSHSQNSNLNKEFDEGGYAKWSNSVADYLLVIRPPQADFTVTTTTHGQPIWVKEDSVAPDRMKKDDPNKGIVQREWRIKKLTDDSWRYDYIPDSLPEPGEWIFALRVMNEFGYWSPWTEKIVPVSNTPPIAKFSPSKDPVTRGLAIDLIDQSYDPNHDKVVKWQWTIEHPSGTITNVPVITSPITNGHLSNRIFNENGIYRVRLKVWDEFGTESLWYSRSFPVVQPTPPPVADFDIVTSIGVPNTEFIMQQYSTRDKSYAFHNPGDPTNLIERWLWELEDPNGNKIMNWQINRSELTGTTLSIPDFQRRMYSIGPNPNWPKPQKVGMYRLRLQVMDTWGQISNVAVKQLQVIAPLNFVKEPVANPQPALAGERVKISLESEGYATHAWVLIPASIVVEEEKMLPPNKGREPSPTPTETINGVGYVAIPLTKRTTLSHEYPSVNGIPFMRKWEGEFIVNVWTKDGKYPIYYRIARQEPPGFAPETKMTSARDFEVKYSVYDLVKPRRVVNPRE